MQIYTPTEPRACAEAVGSDQPTEEHIRVHRNWARLSTDDELRHAIWQAEWLLRVDDGDYPADVLANSLLEDRAVIAAARRELEFRSRRGLTHLAPTYGIPREYLDDLKSRVPIEAEIGVAVTLRRHGTISKGLCPFHEDRQPSLVVWSASQRWRCFGCQTGGDVLDWVQAWMPTDFHGAVAYLAARVGMPLHASMSRVGSLR